MCVEITDAPKLSPKYVETWIFVAVSGQWPLGENIRGSSYCVKSCFPSGGQAWRKEGRCLVLQSYESNDLYIAVLYN